MAKFTTQEIYAKIEAVPIIPLFTHPDITIAKAVVKACYDGGIRVFEYTNRSVGADKVFQELIKYARAEMPDLAMGIGTIFNAQEAEYFVSLDADFIIQPIVNEEVGLVCSKHNIAWMPGAMTVTEVYKAQQGGAEIIKIFPANVLGTAFIKAIKGPMPNVKLMATGGVEPTEASLAAWFSAGVACVGMGSQLFPKHLLEVKDFMKLREVVELCVGSLSVIR